MTKEGKRKKEENTRDAASADLPEDARPWERQHVFANSSSITVTMAFKSCFFLLVVSLGLSRGGKNIEEDQYGVRYATDCEGWLKYKLFLCVFFLCVLETCFSFLGKVLVLRSITWETGNGRWMFRLPKGDGIQGESPPRFRNPTVKVTGPVPRHVTFVWLWILLSDNLFLNGSK